MPASPTGKMPMRRWAGRAAREVLGLRIAFDEAGRQAGRMSSPQVKWSLEADFLQACSCDYGCPCEFSAPPTRGFCDGTGAWRITTGHFGDVALDGITVGFAARWPKAIHEGNGTLAVFIDERATPQQRQALLTICSGQAGGLPFEILAATITKVLDPIFAPIEFNLNGRDSSVYIGKSLQVAMEPIKNPVTKEPE